MVPLTLWKAVFSVTPSTCRKRDDQILQIYFYFAFFTVGINNPEGFRKSCYAMQRSWNGRQSPSWEKLSWYEIALNRWIRNRDSLKQKASLSIIAWLKRNLTTLQVWQKIAGRAVDRTERLNGNRLWLKTRPIVSVQVSIFGGLRLEQLPAAFFCNFLSINISMPLPAIRHSVFRHSMHDRTLKFV